MYGAIVVAVVESAGSRWIKGCVFLARGGKRTVCDNAQAASNADLKEARASEQMMNDVRREIARAKSAADMANSATTIDADSTDCIKLIMGGWSERW